MCDQPVHYSHTGRSIIFFVFSLTPAGGAIPILYGVLGRGGNVLVGPFVVLSCHFLLTFGTSEAQKEVMPRSLQNRLGEATGVMSETPCCEH